MGAKKAWMMMLSGQLRSMHRLSFNGMWDLGCLSRMLIVLSCVHKETFMKTKMLIL